MLSYSYRNDYIPSLEIISQMWIFLNNKNGTICNPHYFLALSVTVNSQKAVVRKEINANCNMSDLKYMQIMQRIVWLFLIYDLLVFLYQFHSSMYVYSAILYLVAMVNSCLATFAMDRISQCLHIIKWSTCPNIQLSQVSRFYRKTHNFRKEAPSKFAHKLSV